MRALPLIQLIDVVKTYGKGVTTVPALRGVNLEVHPGETLILTGPSGCGKTTLISIMGALLDYDSGKCRVEGHELRDLDEVQRAKLRRDTIGFVFQAFNLLPALTASQNVMVPLLLQGLGPAEAARKANVVLTSIGLQDRLHSLPKQLSGGQQQRVAIARAIVHDPSIVVCDEPTSNLDHDTGALIMDVLVRFAAKSGRALVVVTHDPRISGFADRLVTMDDGSIIKDSHSGESME